MTISEFVQANNVTMRYRERTDRNPAMEDSSQMDHWRCVIRAGKKQMSLVFSMGFGLNGKAPDLPDVLDCLASDAAGVENADNNFEDWASEYGYDIDSRKAERTFAACARQAEKLKNLLGDEAYDALLFHTERE